VRPKTGRNRARKLQIIQAAAKAKGDAFSRAKYQIRNKVACYNVYMELPKGSLTDGWSA
jgi:hypothetical protein